MQHEELELYKIANGRARLISKDRKLTISWPVYNEPYAGGSVYFCSAERFINALNGTHYQDLEVSRAGVGGVIINNNGELLHVPEDDVYLIKLEYAIQNQQIVDMPPIEDNYAQNISSAVMA